MECLTRISRSLGIFVLEHNCEEEERRNEKIVGAMVGRRKTKTEKRKTAIGKTTWKGVGHSSLQTFQFPIGL